MQYDDPEFQEWLFACGYARRSRATIRSTLKRVLIDSGATNVHQLQDYAAGASRQVRWVANIYVRFLEAA